MKRPLLLISILMLSANFLNAQEVSAWVPRQWLQSDPNRYVVKGAKGSPDLFDSFIPAIIYMSNGKVIKGVRINLFNEDDLVVAKPYKGFEAHYDIEENEVDHFVTIATAGDTTTFLRLDKSAFTSSYASKAFYEVVSTNQNLIKRSFKELLKAEQPDGYSQVRTTDEFVLSENYFLRNNPSDKYQNIKLARKSISKVLGVQASQAKSIMKKNGWKWNNITHVLLLLEQLQKR